MKRCIVPWLFAMLLLLTACSGSGGSAEDPIKGSNPTPAAQGHALPKENRSAAGTGAVFTDDNGWYICAAGLLPQGRQLPGVGGERQQLRRFGRGALRHPR